MFADQLEDSRASGRQLFLGGPAVGRAGGFAGLDLLAKAGHANLEELVQVAGEDRQELDSLKERIALVSSLEQHAGVELEPGEFAVQVGEFASARATRRVRAGTAGRAVPVCSLPVRSTAMVGWHSWIGRRRTIRPAGEHSMGPRGPDSPMVPVRVSARYRRSPDGGVQPHPHPVARTSGRRRPPCGRKRGSRASSSGSPPPGPIGGPERSTASARYRMRSMQRGDDEGDAAGARNTSPTTVPPSRAGR